MLFSNHLTRQVLASSAQGNTEQLCRVTDAHPGAIYARNRLGYTAAHLAAWEGHVSTLAVLMHLDSSILRAVDVLGQTACHFAAWAGRSASALSVFSDLHLHCTNNACILSQTRGLGDDPEIRPRGDLLHNSCWEYNRASCCTEVSACLHPFASSFMALCRSVQCD